MFGSCPAQSDYERFQGKVDSLIHKPKRSDRENAALAKAEAELTVAKEVLGCPPEAPNQTPSRPDPDPVN